MAFRNDYEYSYISTGVSAVNPDQAGLITDDMIESANDVAFSINFGDLDWPRIARKGDLQWMMDRHSDVTSKLIKSMYGIETKVVIYNQCPDCGRPCDEERKIVDLRNFNMAVILDNNGIPYNKLVMIDLYMEMKDKTRETWKIPFTDQEYDYLSERENIQKYKEFHYLYLMKEEGTNYYKIGICNNAKMRISSMQTANPRRINLMGIKRYDSRSLAQENERIMHSYLRKNKKRATGEWYMIDDPYFVINMKEKLFTEYIHWVE